jgi:hypothetical protein
VTGTGPAVLNSRASFVTVEFPEQSFKQDKAVKKLYTGRNTIRFSFVVAILVAVLSAQTDTLTETFDPSVLNDPEPNWPVVVNPLLGDTLTWQKAVPPDTGRQVVYGYRVQVLATRFADRADSLRSILSPLFNNEVYVTYEAPNYKVRVGNCLDREDAEILKRRLAKKGYSSAWIIRTRVETRALERRF